MAGRRDDSGAEIDVVRKGFGGRSMLRARCYFAHIILQARVQMDVVKVHKQGNDGRSRFDGL
jgi:hypothetical protein